jgi:hypothetical protein
MRAPLLRVLLLLFLLAACAPAPTEPPFVLQLPSPTPAAASATVAPTLTETPLPPSPTATLEESPSATPEPVPTEPPDPTVTAPPLPTLAIQTALPTPLPQPETGSGQIQFLNPGPMSRLLSPFLYYGYAVPGFNHRGWIGLYGEDGRLIDSETVFLSTAFTWAFYSGELEFEAAGAGELGRLSLSTRDAYGRMTALASLHVLLQPEGYSQITPPGNLHERCYLAQPADNRRLSGGRLTVTGEMRPYNSLPLVVELIDRNGTLVGSGLAPVSPAADDRFVPFSVDVDYALASGAWVLISVSQADERIGGLMYVYSHEVYLYP